MINLKNYFDKIYVINLDRRPDRYQSFLEEIKKYNLVGIEKFSAIDGSKLDISDNNLLPGEIGILLSHLEIIKECKENNYNNVLILEDDIYFTEQINNINEYMSLVPNNWDFIYFGGNHKSGQPPIKINEKIIKLNYTLALQCVAINNSMYDIIEVLLEKRKKQVDTYYAELHNTFNAYGFNPNIAKQKPGYSDIQNKNVNYDYFFN